MDRSLDEIVSDRQRSNYRGSRDRRPPRDGVRKSAPRDDNRDLNRDWVHDRFEDDDEEYGRPIRGSSSRNQRGGRRSPPAELSDSSAKLRVENLHYDITEDDIRELFSRKGRVLKVQLLYDRQDRSQGVAYVTYDHAADAKSAIREFDGANAQGQPIRLTLVPSAPPKRNPFDTAERPTRSLFDRVEGAPSRSRGRSESPARQRRSDTTRPAPENIDRYVPGQGGRRDSRGPRRSPNPRGGDRGGDRNARRPGDRRRRDPRREGDGPGASQPRTKKTAEELDAEMEDYWGKNDNSGAAAAPAAAPTATTTDADIDMIE